MRQDSVTFTLQRASSDTLTRWSTDVIEAWDLGLFGAYLGDLDGDGLPELTVVLLRSVSNGMGVESFQVAIIDGQQSTTQPLLFDVEEFGGQGNFLWSPVDRRCRLLVTYWQNGSDRRRGDGLYFTGHWYLYRHGILDMDLQRPEVARRYLNSFAVERSRSGDEGMYPYTWLTDRRAEVAEAIPVLDYADTTGTSEAVIHATQGGVLIAMRTGHPPLPLHPDPWWPDNPRDDSTSYVQIGDLVSGRRYPEGYSPGIDNWLPDRRSRIVERTALDARFRYVWLLPN
jgi:hypothetical protein